MTTKEKILDNKSYQTIYESFQRVFPEFKLSIRKWENCGFNFQSRHILVLLKNGCTIIFGCNKSEGEWIWSANLDMSDKIKKQFNITFEE